jgi:lipopolysaccharide biosynthesis glycosyltransferase
MNRAVAVAFCTDQFMEAPLHVAMSSLLRNLAAGFSARFYLILTGFTPEKLAHLRQTLDATQREYTLQLLDPVDTSIFDAFPDLHGSRTTYHRLLLPDLVSEPRLLYLDSDILVETDIAPLFELDMGQAPIGTIISGSVQWALDREFQYSVGRKPGDPSFNAGVVLFNLAEWHRQECTQKVFAFGSEHGARMCNRDESLLNALFANSCCCRLDRKFNFRAVPETDPATIPAQAIVHYIGSPKPWDICGRYVHRCAAPWYRALKQTSVPLLQRLTWIDRSAWRRLPKIAGGYRRTLRVHLEKLLGR